MQQEPQGSCGSLVDPLVPGLVKNPGAPVRRVMVRPDAEDSSARGEERRRKSPRQTGNDVLRRGLGDSGTTAVEPERAGSSALESAELSTSYSSEFEVVEHRGREGAGVRRRSDVPVHDGLSVRKSLTSENPMSGSGPSVSARPEGDQTVEGARNPEDGRRRAGRPDATIPPLMSLKGRETPGGAIRSVLDRRGRLGPNPERETKPAGAAGRSSDRTDGRTAKHLVVVQTTWRRRRTNRAATPSEALREAGQP